MKLYNGDCLEVMKELPDNSIDLCISSPPYNIGKSYNTYNDTRKAYIDWSIQVWNEVCRLLKDNGHLFVNIQYQKNTPFDIYKIFDNINWKLQNNIIWAKAVEIDGYVRGYTTPHNSKRYLQNGWEHIFHFTKNGNTNIDLEYSSVPYNTDYNNAERNFKRSGRNWRPTTNAWHFTYKSKATKEITKQIAGKVKHPAIFPEKLVAKCIKVSGLKKGVVLDNFMGTGTTGLVSQKYNLDFIGIEIDKEYYNFAKERIDEKLYNNTS